MKYYVLSAASQASELSIDVFFVSARTPSDMRSLNLLSVR